MNSPDAPLPELLDPVWLERTKYTIVQLSGPKWSLKTVWNAALAEADVTSRRAKVRKMERREEYLEEHGRRYPSADSLEAHPEVLADWMEVAREDLVDLREGQKSHVGMRNSFTIAWALTLITLVPQWMHQPGGMAASVLVGASCLYGLGGMFVWWVLSNLICPDWSSDIELLKGVQVKYRDLQRRMRATE